MKRTSSSRTKQIIAFVIALLVPLAVGGIGSLVTISEIPNWYTTIAKPNLNPPNWLFGPVWTLLYVLMGISLFLIWRQHRARHKAYIVFAVQLLLNLAWSVVFFGFHQLWLAFIVIVALALAIVVTIKAFLPLSRAAALLLAPYLAWVIFASSLNLSIAILN